MTTLLYFEEYVSDLSKKLNFRNDINVIILRAKKTIGKYISQEELTNSKYSYFVFDTDADYDVEFKRFYIWLLENNYKIDYILNDSEYYLDFANKIGRSLHLECLSEEQTKWVRDKFFMKERFREIGFNTVDFSIVKSKREILDFFEKQNGRPIIFKPRNMMNSINVYKINSISDIEQLNFNLENEEYMVESYCEDQEWSIESLVQDGKVLDSYVTYIPNRTLWAAMDGQLNCHMTVPSIPQYFQFNPKDFIQKIVDGMNLKNGAMTIEVFIDNQGNVMPSELGWRLPGCQATKNHGKSYGFDMYDSLIDIAIHKPVHLEYKEKIYSVGDLYLPNKDGEISKITSLDELLAMDGVIDGQMFVQSGDFVKKRRVGNDASGWVQIIGENEFDTLHKMQKVFDAFEIELLDEMGGKKYVKKI